MLLALRSIGVQKRVSRSVELLERGRRFVRGAYRPMAHGTTVSPVTVVGSIVVAIFGCLGAVWLSARIYRVGMLMYGKKPSFAEVARWIRYA